jgi:hypothetical protein
MIKEQSGILGGTLRLRQVEKSLSLIRDDVLEIDHFTGRIHDWSIHSDGFRVALAGRASDIRLGTENRSVLPSELEVLRADSSLAVYWGSALWLASVLISILQWYRSER